MKLLSTLFFTSVLFSSSVLAIDNYHIECNTCVTEAQFVQAAKDNAIHRETIFVNVMNLENHEIKKYKVYKNSKTVCDPNGREPDGEGGFIRDCWLEKTLTADKVNLTNTELNAFINYADLQNDLRKIISQRSIIIPDTVVGSGYELVGASYKQTTVSNYFRELPIHSTLAERMVHYASVGTKIVSAGVVLNAPPLVFTCSDGTKVYADIEFYDMDDNLHLKFIKVIDANGNQANLQSKTVPFSKFFDAKGTSLTTWKVLLEAFKAYGLAVDVSNTATVPKGVVTITDCSNSTETVCRNPL